MGANYENEVYYKLSLGQVKAEPIKNWDLAFSTVASFDKRFFAIRANYSNGIRVYEYPKVGVSDWATLDTTGWSTNWVKLYNTDSSWWYGAFNLEPYSHPSYSWGTYTNSGEITGNKIYLIGFSQAAFLEPTSFKKLIIEQRKSASGVRVWKFKYADIDGSNEKSVTIEDKNYEGKTFAYYSLRDNKELSREPDNSTNSWDITFTRYWADLMNPQFPYYQVTGVLHNVNVEIFKATGLPTKDLTKPVNNSNYSHKINTIGYNWKNAGPNGTTIEDSTAYFIKVDSIVGNKIVNTKIYKLWFTDFGGSANGKVVFNTELVENTDNTVSIKELDSQVSLNIYPNPAQNQITITTLNNTATPTAVNIYDISGKQVYNYSISNNQSWSVYTLDVSGFAKGVYIVSVSTDKGAITKRLVKQ